MKQSKVSNMFNINADSDRGAIVVSSSSSVTNKNSQQSKS